MRELLAQAGLQPPSISIVIPVYGVEQYLRRALDSCLAQTLQEIEIITVNDCSPDASQAIIDEYAAKYPDKIIPLQHEVNRGPTPARETGYRHARAPYVLFLDPDDWYDPRTCETTLRCALTGGHDLVCFRFAKTDENLRCVSIEPVLENCDRLETIPRCMASFCTYLFHRDLLAGDNVFLPMFFEDAAVIPRVVAMARSLCWFTDFPLYHYFTRSGSTMDTFIRQPQKLRDLLRSDELLWEHAEERIRPEMAARVATDLWWLKRKYPQLTTVFTAHTKQLYPRIRPFLPEETPASIITALEAAMALPEEPRIPLIVYVDGFGGAEGIEHLPGATVVPLTEANCDLDSAPAHIRQAHESGRTEEAAAWFAMAKIRSTGGFYAARGMRIMPAADALRYHEAVFAAGTGHASLHFFGGAAGSPWWDRLLAAEDASQALLEGGVTLSGAEEDGADGLHILPLQRTVLPMEHAYCCCEGPLPPALSQALCARIAAMETQLADMDRLARHLEETTAQRDRYLRERDAARQERSHFKHKMQQLEKRRLPDYLAELIHTRR